MRKWRKRETGLSVDFANDGGLVARFLHEGAAGTKDSTYRLDDQGDPPAEYYEARKAAVAGDESASPTIVLPRLKQLLSEESPNYKKAAKLVEGLEPYQHRITDSHRSYLLRYKGELANGNTDTALKLWEQALELNPKVGIKGRYDKERKKASDAPAELRLASSRPEAPAWGVPASSAAAPSSPVAAPSPAPRPRGRKAPPGITKFDRLH